MILKVNTKYGIVEGQESGQKGISVFKGIPYATPPIGELRWRAPLPPEKWEGVRKCNAFGNPCIQLMRPSGGFYEKEFYKHSFHSYPPPWSEDCLYLNIWTPAKGVGEKLPVMMWIHGGGFIQGYGHEPRYDGETLAGKGVILVSINYRLTIFGYYGHPELTQESGFSGNYGVLDQIAALQWIRDNIEGFGGDPDNVTMFGQSAGAISVQAIAASPLAKGLVHHAIAQSGAGLSVPQMRFGLPFLEQRGVEFMEDAGAKSIAALRALPAEKVLDIIVKTNRDSFGAFPIVADGYVLPMDKGTTFLAGKQLDIDYLVGSTIDESQIFPSFQPEAVTKESFRKTMVEKRGIWFKLLADCCDPKDDYEAWVLLNKAHGMQWMAEHRALAYVLDTMRKKPVYSYTFTRKVPGDDNPGAFHSSCIWYAMGTHRNCWRTFTPEDEKLSETMVSYWTNFAKSGNPNGEGLPVWNPFTTGSQLEMKLDLTCEMYDFAHENSEMIKLQKLLAEEKV